MTNKSILITGGTGFIGSSLIKRIVTMGQKPIVLVRKNSDLRRLSSYRNKVAILSADLTNVAEIKKIVQKEQPKIVFHLAAYGVYTYADLSYENAKQTIDSNIYGTINLFYALKNVGCEVIINTGSCFEYGSKKTPFEEDDVLVSCNVYGISKVATTQFAINVSKNWQLPIVTLRPFTAYGPWQDTQRFIATAIDQCLAGKDIAITKENMVRDYIYIDDVVDGYLAAAASGKKLVGEVINISTGIGYNLIDVAHLLIKLTKAKSKIRKGAFPKRDGEVIELIGSAKKAEDILHWKAKYSLEEGLIETITWVKNR